MADCLFLGHTLEDVGAAFTCASHSWFFVSGITHRTIALWVWSISLNKIVGLDIGKQGMKSVFAFPAFIKVFCTCTLLLFLMSDLAVAVFCFFLSGHMFLVKASKGLLGLVLCRWFKWTGKSH